MRSLLLTCLFFATPALAQGLAPAPAAAPAVKGKPAADDPYWQQSLCRKDVETGSLVKVRRTCHTRQQWAYIEDANRDVARRLEDDNRIRPANQ